MKERYQFHTTRSSTITPHDPHITFPLTIYTSREKKRLFSDRKLWTKMKTKIKGREEKKREKKEVVKLRSFSCQ